MKILAYTEDNHEYSPAIVQMGYQELNDILGIKYKDRRPKVGAELKPCERIRLSNDIIAAGRNAMKTAEQLRALAALIDTTIPGIDAVVNPVIDAEFEVTDTSKETDTP